MNRLPLGLFAALLLLCLSACGAQPQQQPTPPAAEEPAPVQEAEETPPAPTAEELAELPGIGEELARRIVEYRTEHGPFGDVAELMEVSGIGEGKMDALKDRVTVDGEETK